MSGEPGLQTRLRALGCLLWLVAASACSSRHTELLRPSPSRSDAAAPAEAGPVERVDAAQTAAPATTDAAAPEAAPPNSPTLGTARCGKRACACDDGLDNDADGSIDGLDPECTGALDEDEASFATGKPSKAKQCRDCFWDEDMGTGNDACRYASECLRGLSATGNGNCGSCEVSAKCVDTCASRTPSGCDCFGCCEVARPDGVVVTIELSERCSLDRLDDTAACPRCRQSSQCRNVCGRCELCPGRSLTELPADCGQNPPLNRCDEGQSVCSTSAGCGTDQYCHLGCCFAVLL